MKRNQVAILFFAIVAVFLLVFYPVISRYDLHSQANRVFEQGIKCELNEDYLCARNKYQQAIEIYDRDSEYFFRLAHVQSRLGENLAAIENYRRAKTLNPSNEEVLPELNRLIHQQATQAAATAGVQTVESLGLLSTPTPFTTLLPAPGLVYSIFDEEFGIIKSVMPTSGSPDDEIQYKISEEEAYSGKKSLKVTWTKYQMNEHWASLILGFDPEIENRKKAELGGMVAINLNPPSEYAIRFFVKGFTSSSDYGDARFTIKFQDQNLLFNESLGNQVVYVHYDKGSFPGGFRPDGRLPLTSEWTEMCLPLVKFRMDWWLSDKYSNFSDREREFDWSNVKQINIDADYFSAFGTLYLDDVRIIKVSDCVPYPFP